MRILIYLVTAYTAWTTATAATVQDVAPPVRVDVYFEILCGDSREFIGHQLGPTWTRIKDIMDVETNPFGKANFTAEGEGYSFVCQHGPEECNGNMMLNCGKKYIEDQDLYIQWIACVMNSFYPPFAGGECASSVGIDTLFPMIHDCATGIEGQQLLHDVGVKTEQLDPELTYVPWIIINDEWSWEMNQAAELDLLDVVCKAYTGEAPEPCHHTSADHIFLLDPSS